MTPIHPWAWSRAAAVAGGTWGARGGRSWPHRGGDPDQPGGRV